MKYVILNLIKDKPMHGYEVMKALRRANPGLLQAVTGHRVPDAAMAR